MKNSVSTSMLLATSMLFASPASAALEVSGDPVLYWNDLVIGVLGGGAPVQARIMAMLNTAMHDAVNNSVGGPNIYYNKGVGAPGGNTRAAASVAARNLLVEINPANTAVYDAALKANLDLVADGAAKTNGMATGAAYATAMRIARMGDGSVAPAGFMYTPGTAPGQWRPTAPGASAALPHWGGVKPFLIGSVADFRPDAPPKLDSPEYLAAYNEVKVVGSATATIAERSADQTASALFWDASNGTTWHRIAVDVIADDGLSTLENAKVMAKLSSAVADSLIVGFDAKYTYNLWRPITAIRQGEADGVDATEGDAGWTSLFPAPMHPSYLSTHSLQSGAASAVLLGLGIDQPFKNTISGDSREFTSIGQAALDAANSRLWGGIHFRFDNEIGLSTGQMIGQFALAQDAFNAVPEPTSWALMITGFGLVGAGLRRRVARVAFAVA